MRITEEKKLVLRLETENEEDINLIDFCGALLGELSTCLIKGTYAVDPVDYLITESIFGNQEIRVLHGGTRQLSISYKGIEVPVSRLQYLSERLHS